MVYRQKKNEIPPCKHKNQLMHTSIILTYKFIYCNWLPEDSLDYTYSPDMRQLTIFTINLDQVQTSVLHKVERDQKIAKAKKY